MYHSTFLYYYISEYQATSISCFLVIKVTSEACQGQRSDTCGGCHPGPQGPAGTLVVLLTEYKTGIPRLWTGWCLHLRENRGGDTNGLGGQKGKGLHWVGRNSKERKIFFKATNEWMNKQQVFEMWMCAHLISPLLMWLLWRPDMFSLALRSLRVRAWKWACYWYQRFTG